MPLLLRSAPPGHPEVVALPGRLLPALLVPTAGCPLMFADDNKDKINGLRRQFDAIARSPQIDPEDLVHTFAVLREALDEAEALAVGRLRYQGRSWDEIGAAMGMTRQAAHKRFRLVPVEP